MSYLKDIGGFLPSELAAQVALSGMSSTFFYVKSAKPRRYPAIAMLFSHVTGSNKRYESSPYYYTANRILLTLTPNHTIPHRLCA